MRPRGEIRIALHDAATALAPERRAMGMPGVHWRELAEHACVGYAAARETVRNMVRAGDLRPVGTRRVPGARRAMTVYEPAVGAQDLILETLQDLLQLWSRA